MIYAKYDYDSAMNKITFSFFLLKNVQSYRLMIVSQFILKSGESVRQIESSVGDFIYSSSRVVGPWNHCGDLTAHR